jgi:hypothetical protein
VKCWVDEDEWMGVNVIGYWKEIVNIGRYILLILSISYAPYLLYGLVSSLSLSSNQDNENDNDNES